MHQKTLSIFIDESGDFGPYEPHSPLWLIALVFHDQEHSLASELASFSVHLGYNGYSHHAVHTGPLLRREGFYDQDEMGKWKKLFSSLFNFARKIPVQYEIVCIDKKYCKNALDMTVRISIKIQRNIYQKRGILPTVRPNPCLL